MQLSPGNPESPNSSAKCIDKDLHIFNNSQMNVGIARIGGHAEVLLCGCAHYYWSLHSITKEGKGR